MRQPIRQPQTLPRRGVQVLIFQPLHSLKNKEDSKRLLTLKSKAILYTAEIYNAMGKKNIAYETLLPIINGNLPLKEEALIRGGELLLEQRKIVSLGEFLKCYDGEVTQLRIEPNRRY